MHEHREPDDAEFRWRAFLQVADSVCLWIWLLAGGICMCFVKRTVKCLHYFPIGRCSQLSFGCWMSMVMGCSAGKDVECACAIAIHALHSKRKMPHAVKRMLDITDDAHQLWLLTLHAYLPCVLQSIRKMYGPFFSGRERSPDGCVFENEPGITSVMLLCLTFSWSVLRSDHFCHALCLTLYSGGFTGKKSPTDVGC